MTSEPPAPEVKEAQRLCTHNPLISVEICYTFKRAVIVVQSRAGRSQIRSDYTRSRGPRVALTAKTSSHLGTPRRSSHQPTSPPPTPQRLFTSPSANLRLRRHTPCRPGFYKRKFSCLAPIRHRRRTVLDSDTLSSCGAPLISPRASLSQLHRLNLQYTPTSSLRNTSHVCLLQPSSWLNLCVRKSLAPPLRLQAGKRHSGAPLRPTTMLIEQGTPTSSPLAWERLA
jgi:hypothetical protein